MNAIPRAALVLTALGAAPFVIGAAMALLNVPSSFWGYEQGDAVQLDYGKIILSFMGGCLWGFGAKSAPERSANYMLSVLPALWAFLIVGSNLWLLAIGFAGLFALDYVFASRSLAPSWWLTLRLPITAVVLLCLIIGALTQ